MVDAIGNLHDKTALLALINLLVTTITLQAGLRTTVNRWCTGIDQPGAERPERF
jgi:hypothetical protein